MENNIIIYIARYSSFDIKIGLRGIFEDIYIVERDKGHLTWVLGLIKQSLVYHLNLKNNY